VTVKAEFWATREDLLRGYLERGTGLREAAMLIGATYPATEAKARRLGIWPRQKTATEVASASEWVLAGYEGEEELRLSGGLDVTPHALILEHPDPVESRHLTKSEQRVMKRALRGSTRLIAEGGEAAAKPIAADSRDEEKRVGGGDTECWFCTICRTMTLLAKAEAGECCVEPRREDCPTGLMVSPSEEGGIDGDQIPRFVDDPSALGERVKPKRITRPKPPKLVLSEPAEAADNGAKMVIQLDASPAPTKKREWDFPPPGGCLFPFGDVGRPGFGFCSEPVVKTGVPYCREHIQRVYGRGVTREEV
jgi:hypothetical protein